MITVTRVFSDCGLTLAVDHGAVVPLTPCCGVHADPGRDVTLCSRCLRVVNVGYSFAAFIGHPDYLRDLRTMVDTLTKCAHPGECVAELAEDIERT